MGTASEEAQSSDNPLPADQVDFRGTQGHSSALDRMHLGALRLGDGVPESFSTLAMSKLFCPYVAPAPGKKWQLISLSEWSCMHPDTQSRICSLLQSSAGNARLPVAFRADGSDEINRLSSPNWLPQQFNESSNDPEAVKALERPDSFRRKLLNGCPFMEAGVSQLAAGPYEAFVNPTRQAALGICRAVDAN